MLRGRLFIDNQDAYEYYGLYVKDYTPLIAYPQYKSLQTNDWHERDGVEVDLSNPVLNSRQFVLQFYCGRPEGVSDAQVLLSDLASTVYHSFYFAEIDKTYILRMIDTPSFSQNSRFDNFSITFCEDNVPMPNGGVPSTVTGISLGYTIDDADFALYGCTVLKGTRDSFLKFSKPKEAWKSNYSIMHGVIYDANDNVRLKSKDITIKLHIRTSSVSEFWERWDALWTAVFLVKDTEGLSAAERIVEGDGMIFRCYYKKNDVSEFLFTPEGGIWCDFTITFSVIAYNRGDAWYYLEMEDGVPVLYEYDNENNDNPTLVRIR